MGEVYKARDTRLERTVAIKILPPQFAENPDMKQRFEREAKAISALAHVNICALFDVGSEGGTDFLVMEHLEGQTLAERLESGPLGPDQVMKIAIEIAAALGSAHHAGIIHRDLKPGNIMLTKGGVKLLDFGLAKNALTAPKGSSGALLPTETLRGMTQQGTILGTLQYMSPEQLEGQDADARSDIFSFGVVLYEMATGRKAFEGKSQAALISAILKDQPQPLSAVAPLTPPALDRVVSTCLAKDPDERFQTAHDIRLQLQWLAEGGSQVGLPAPVAQRRRSRERLAWLLAGAAALAAAVLGAGFLLRAPGRPQVIRFELSNPPEITRMGAPRISPDGRYLAYNATDTTGRTLIWVRALNALAAQPLAGTEEATRPFWSPDSRFLGFIAEGKLKKIEVTGGPATKICDAPGGSDGSWSSEGVILFDGSGTDAIRRVQASGGIASNFVKPVASRGESAAAWPEFLPDGRHFLYMAQGVKADDTCYRLGSLDSTDTKFVAPAQTAAVYAPPGYLLFMRDRTLLAQAFDPKAGKVSGEPVPVAEHLNTDSVGLARFTASRNGILIYQTGESGDKLVWVDRSGKEGEIQGDPGDYHNPTFAPGGDRVAFDLVDPHSGKNDIWIRDLKRNVSSRFTFSAGGAAVPSWSHDGKRLAYSSGTALSVKEVEGQAAERTLIEPGTYLFANDWSPDGRYLVYTVMGKDTNWDLWVLPTSGEAKPFPFLATPFAEMMGVFHPGGQFLAYMSNESGRMEIYVQSFPGPGGKWQISSAGGVEPQWRGDGKELYYRAPDQKLMAVEVQVNGSSLTVATPHPLFQGRFDAGQARNRYLPSADGQRFLTVAPLGRDAMTPSTVVLNWAADLGR